MSLRAIENGPWLWQSNTFYTGYSGFFKFCDAVEVRPFSNSRLGLCEQSSHAALECHAWSKAGSWTERRRSGESTERLCVVVQFNVPAWM
jgi:hypothetical protein